MLLPFADYYLFKRIIIVGLYFTVPFYINLTLQTAMEQYHYWCL